MLVHGVVQTRLVLLFLLSCRDTGFLVFGIHFVRFILFVAAEVFDTELFTFLVSFAANLILYCLLGYVLHFFRWERSWRLPTSISLAFALRRVSDDLCLHRGAIEGDLRRHTLVRLLSDAALLQAASSRHWSLF